MSEMDLFSTPPEATSDPQKWVTVSNEMVMARMDWDIMMHRVMMVLISQVDSQNDERFRLQQVRVRDIRDMAQVSQKSIHREAAEAASKLVRQPIEFWSEDKQDYEGYPIFSVCKYRSRLGVIEAKFNDDARQYLLQLSKRFTQYRLKQAIPLSTPYAIRTYEIAKMIERPGKRRVQEITVSRFRQMFRLEEKYSRHCDMRRRVIDPSIEEVNRKCDVEVSCRDVRNGQTPVALKWKVTSHQESGSSAKTSNPEAKPSRLLAVEDGDASDEPYRRWFDALPEPERRQVRAEAEARATNEGFSSDNAMSFKAGVEMKLHGIYRERNKK